MTLPATASGIRADSRLLRGLAEVSQHGLGDERELVELPRGEQIDEVAADGFDVTGGRLLDGGKR